jgi:FAD/FMN-containing dehydrogenase
MRRKDGAPKRLPVRPKTPTGVAVKLPFSEAKRAAFLRDLASHGVAREAARAADVPMSTLAWHRRRDPAFAAEWRDSVEQADSVLEREAVRRAVDGCARPVVQKGQIVRDSKTGQAVEIVEYSDRLMEVLLRARIPRFRERREVDVHHTMAANAVAYLSVEDVAALNRDERRTLLGILRRIADSRKARADEEGRQLDDSSVVDAEFWEADALPPPDPDDLKEICS